MTKKNYFGILKSKAKSGYAKGKSLSSKGYSKAKSGYSRGKNISKKGYSKAKSGYSRGKDISRKGYSKAKSGYAKGYSKYSKGRSTFYKLQSDYERLKKGSRNRVSIASPKAKRLRYIANKSYDELKKLGYLKRGKRYKFTRTGRKWLGKY